MICWAFYTTSTWIKFHFFLEKLIIVSACGDYSPSLKSYKLISIKRFFFDVTILPFFSESYFISMNSTFPPFNMESFHLYSLVASLDWNWALIFPRKKLAKSLFDLASKVPFPFTYSETFTKIFFIQFVNWFFCRFILLKYLFTFTLNCFFCWFNQIFRIKLTTLFT